MTSKINGRNSNISKKDTLKQSLSSRHSVEKERDSSRKSFRVKTKTIRQTHRGANDGYLKIIRDVETDDFDPSKNKRYPAPPIGQTMRHQKL